MYNAASYLEKAVKSALEQKEVAEVLLIEDGSKDDSLEICRRLEKKDERIILLRHHNGENRGAGPSRNLGLRNTTYELIAFLDADDYYLPDRFKNDLKIFEENQDFDAVFNAIGAEFYSEKAQELFSKKELTTLHFSESMSATEILDQMFLVGGHISLDGITIRKRSLNQLAFDEALKQGQDTDFLIKLILYCKCYPGILDKAVTIRGVHENNRIHNRSEAKYFAGILAKKWLFSRDIYKFSSEAALKLFYRYSSSDVFNKGEFIRLISTHFKTIKKIGLRNILYTLRK